jgi:hypothetical protein
MKKFTLFLLLGCIACNTDVIEDSKFLERLMKTKPEHFEHILLNRDSLEVQIIYTQIDRNERNEPSFKSFYFNVDSTHYFYPASTVKLPMCLLALEKLNQLSVSRLDRYTPMFHDSAYAGQLSVREDTTSENGLPSVAHYIKKILVVSDNDAYNRLYEFLGQKAANENLNHKGYNVRFLHRLERFLSPDENRHTEAIRFINDDRIIYQQPMLFNMDSIRPVRYAFRGKGYMKNDTVLIHKPFNFTYKNFYSLTDQQKVLRALIFPETVNEASRFELTQGDYEFIYKYMSQLPTETSYPAYATDSTYYDAYCKYFMYGTDRDRIPDHIRIFNKVGDAYGYLIDNAYIVDFKNGVEFMLSAVINTNTDGIYNDGKYEHEILGFPFFRNLGQLIYDYELQRNRKVKPDLSRFVFKYDLERK